MCVSLIGLLGLLIDLVKSKAFIVDTQLSAIAFANSLSSCQIPIKTPLKCSFLNSSCKVKVRNRLMVLHVFLAKMVLLQAGTVSGKKQPMIIKTNSVNDDTN